MTASATPSTEVSRADLALFTRQLGAMLDAGVDVLRALRIAGHHTGNERLMGVVREVMGYLEDGREFHQAIARHPDLFEPFYVEMTRQGEADGTLGKALLSIADYLDRTSQPAPGQAVPVPAGTSPAVAATTMITLAVLALGAAIIWAIATAQPEILPFAWLGPISLFWSAVCLLAGAWLLRQVRQPAKETPDGPAPLPAKTPERKLAEAEAVVRGALEEQAEAEAAAAPAPVEPPLSPNGKTADVQPNGAGADDNPDRLRL